MNYIGVLILCCLAAIQTGNCKRSRLTNDDVVPSSTIYPYQVSLQIDGQHICGGTIIGKKHVLTAAHCTYKFVQYRVDKSRIKVVVGTTATASGTKMAVDRIAVHGNYVPSTTRPTLVADICVIRLKNEITESDSVKTIGLPAEGEEVPEGTRLIISGYGAKVLKGPTSPVLKHMYEYAVGSARCQQAWGSSLNIGPMHLCAALARGYGACEGDSGGPLVKEDKTVVVGVVSAVSGEGCGTGVPDLFTKVSYYLPFIRSEMANTEVSQEAPPLPPTVQLPGWTGTGVPQGGWLWGLPQGWRPSNPGGSTAPQVPQLPLAPQFPWVGQPFTGWHNKN